MELYLFPFFVRLPLPRPRRSARDAPPARSVRPHPRSVSLRAPRHGAGAAHPTPRRHERLRPSHDGHDAAKPLRRLGAIAVGVPLGTQQARGRGRAGAGGDRAAEDPRRLLGVHGRPTRSAPPSNRPQACAPALPSAGSIASSAASAAAVSGRASPRGQGRAPRDRGRAARRERRAPRSGDARFLRKSLSFSCSNMRRRAPGRATATASHSRRRDAHACSDATRANVP